VVVIYNSVIHRMISGAGKYSHEQDVQQKGFGLMPALQPVVQVVAGKKVISEL